MKEKFMEKHPSLVIGGLCLLVAVVTFFGFVYDKVEAQSGPSAVQQTATMLNAATKVAVGQASAGSQSTATMAPSGSNYVYITGIDLEDCATGSAPAAQNNVNFTSTNLTGAPLWQISLAASANTCTPVKYMTFATPLKSTTPGVSTTIVGPAGLANTQQTITVYWYEAP